MGTGRMSASFFFPLRLYILCHLFFLLLLRIYVCQEKRCERQSDTAGLAQQ